MPVLWVQREVRAAWEPVEIEVGGIAGGLIVAINAGRHALITAPGLQVWVNGEPLALGIRVLRHRDAVCVGGRGELFYYSTESLPQVIAYPGPSPVQCARSKSEIQPGELAVSCPRCGAWHRQSEDFPAWTYAEHCALCDQPTALNETYAWTPEGI